jgi:hypothetical protein
MRNIPFLQVPEPHTPRIISSAVENVCNIDQLSNGLPALNGLGLGSWVRVGGAG